jgi:hypothetical protein
LQKIKTKHEDKMTNINFKFAKYWCILIPLLSACGGGGGGAISEINRNTAPELSSSVDFLIDENTSEVSTFQAIDADGDSITYSIGGVDAALFFIGSTSGQLAFTLPPDYENPEDNDVDNIYEVVIIASDGELSISLAIMISVNDVEDPLPEISIPIVSRTSEQITLAYLETTLNFGANTELEFYRNNAYECGISGNYTFLVINPVDDPKASAPLWVWLHGGAQGYFDEQSTYQAGKGMSEHRWNNEETFDALWQEVLVRITQNDGQLKDNTLRRRIQEGYRILVVSMCDHDWYSGMGTNYPNNPYKPDAQVNGLQATMAAVDYTTANYATTHVWAHGTSAGSLGIWALASSYKREGIPLTGIIPDSGVINPYIYDIFDEYLLAGMLDFPSTWTPDGIIEKVGYYGDPGNSGDPETQIRHDGFRETPAAWIVGMTDSAVVAHLDPVPEAITAGFDNNPEYIYQGVVNAIASQSNSPHQVHFLEDTGHVPTHDHQHLANDIVDDFINEVMATNPPLFGANAAPD